MWVNVRVTPLAGKEHVRLYRSYSMSLYFQGLPKDARDRSEQKLTLSGFSLEEDPYSPNRSDKWSPDVAFWPSIDYGDYNGIYQKLESVPKFLPRNLLI